MHTLHAALCMRIADALKAVARIGSPRLVAYGDLMFGRITILMPQYSRRQVGRGAPRAARAGTSRWRIGRSTCWLWRASPDGSRRATSQASPRLAPAVLTPG